MNDSTERRRIFEAVVAAQGGIGPSDAFSGEPVPATLPKYVGVEQYDTETWYTFEDTEAALVAYWDQDDSGYVPHEIVDLDTGESRLIGVRYHVTGHVISTYGGPSDAVRRHRAGNHEGIHASACSLCRARGENEGGGERE
jgi:hypothetical protein